MTKEKKPEAPKPLEFMAIGNTKMRLAGLRQCCYSSLLLYFAQGGNDKPGATHACQGCGATMVARKDYWERQQ